MFRTIKENKIPYIYNAGSITAKEYLNERKVRIKTPSISFYIAPWGFPFMPIEIASENLGHLVQSYSFFKSRTMPGGQATITIVGDENTNRFIGDLFKTKKPKHLDNLWSSLGMDLRELFKPMSYCQIWRDGYHVFSGYITSCTRDVSNDTITYTIIAEELGTLLQHQIIDTIQGEKYDQLKILESAKLGLSFLNFGDFSLANMLSLNGRLINKDIDMALQGLINTYFFSLFVNGFTLSEGFPLFKRFIALPTPLGGISRSSLISKFTLDTSLYNAYSGQTMWDVIRSLCPEPFMEVFTESGGRTIVTERIITKKFKDKEIDTSSFTSFRLNLGTSALLPGMNYLVVRTSPYDVPWIGWIGNSPYGLLITNYLLGFFDLFLGGDFVVISDIDVISKNLGHSHKQQFTLFNAHLSGSDSNQPGNKAVTYNPSVSRGPLIPYFSGGVKTFGIREFRSYINIQRMKKEILEPSAMATDAEKKFFIEILSHLLNYWFRNASKFNEGTITIRGMPYARPGMYLLYLPTKTGKVDNWKDIGVYYIESITDNYNIDGTDTTTLNVIRGIPIPIKGQNILKILYDWEIMPITF